MRTFHLFLMLIAFTFLSLPTQSHAQTPTSATLGWSEADIAFKNAYDIDPTFNAGLKFTMTPAVNAWKEVLKRTDISDGQREIGDSEIGDRIVFKTIQVVLNATLSPILITLNLQIRLPQSRRNDYETNS
jgi:hypothetical protein